MTGTAQTIIFVGIDVSKDELVISCKVKGQFKTIKIENTLTATGSWLKEFGIKDKHFVLEHTGVYSQRIIHALHEQGALFSAVNSSVSRAMSNVLTKTHKNDTQDAQTLSILGQKLELKAYKMPDDIQKKRTESFSALESLKKQEGQLRNQLHAFEYRVSPNPVAVKALGDVLKSVEAAIGSLEKDILPPPATKSGNAAQAQPEQEQDPATAIMDLICSVKSVGKVTAMSCITLYGDFQQFGTAKAFVKFIGLSPTEYSSGSSVRGRSSINKKGKSAVRSLLFNCARNAIQFNPVCKELYRRLLEKGKNGKAALTAVMHKLARLIFGVVRSKQPFDPDYARNKQIVTI